MNNKNYLLVIHQKRLKAA